MSGFNERKSLIRELSYSGMIKKDSTKRLTI